MAIEDVKELASRIPDLRSARADEAKTKQFLILPVIKSLGYDILKPAEVVPEYTVDYAGREGWKVDYALMAEGNLRVVVECKPISNSLLMTEVTQLGRYFTYARRKGAQIAILTNGVIYKFFTDQNEPNIMDQDPFWEIDLENLNDNDLIQLRNISKENFDSASAVQTAWRIKSIDAMKQTLNRQYNHPEDAFAEWLARPLLQARARMTDTIKEMAMIAFHEFVKDTVSDALKSLQSPSLKRDEDDSPGGDAASETAGGGSESPDGEQRNRELRELAGRAPLPASGPNPAAAAPATETAAGLDASGAEQGKAMPPEPPPTTKPKKRARKKSDTAAAKRTRKPADAEAKKLATAAVKTLDKSGADKATVTGQTASAAERPPESAPQREETATAPAPAPSIYWQEDSSDVVKPGERNVIVRRGDAYAGTLYRSKNTDGRKGWWWDYYPEGAAAAAHSSRNLTDIKKLVAAGLDTAPPKGAVCPTNPTKGAMGAGEPPAGGRQAKSPRRAGATGRGKAPGQGGGDDPDEVKRVKQEIKRLTPPKQMQEKDPFGDPVGLFNIRRTPSRR